MARIPTSLALPKNHRDLMISLDVQDQIDLFGRRFVPSMREHSPSARTHTKILKLTSRESIKKKPPNRARSRPPPPCSDDSPLRLV